MIKPKNKTELKQIIKDRIEKKGPKCGLNDIDVSEITNMSYLFYGSCFQGDISKWNVSNVIRMEYMFTWSHFNKSISKWNIKNVIAPFNIYLNCPLEDQKDKQPKCN